MKKPTKRSEMSHPMQPIGIADDGCVRFKQNEIVRTLLDQRGGLDLDGLARMQFSDEDWEQLAQLIGYSVSGWGSLSYVRSERATEADREAARVLRRIGRQKPKRSR